MKALVLFVLIVLLIVGCGAPPRSTTRAVTVRTPSPTIAVSVEPTPTTPPTNTSDGISWEDASAHVGEFGTVCGPVVNATYRPDVNGSPTWLNVGRNYPDSSRFQIVIWGEDRGNFASAPEVAYSNEYVCATGTIEQYQGVAQMIISTPSSLSTQ